MVRPSLSLYSSPYLESTLTFRVVSGPLDSRPSRHSQLSVGWCSVSEIYIGACSKRCSDIQTPEELLINDMIQSASQIIIQAIDSSPVLLARPQTSIRKPVIVLVLRIRMGHLPVIVGKFVSTGSQKWQMFLVSFTLIALLVL